MLKDDIRQQKKAAEAVTHSLTNSTNYRIVIKKETMPRTIKKRVRKATNANRLFRMPGRAF